MDSMEPYDMCCHWVQRWGTPEETSSGRRRRSGASWRKRHLSWVGSKRKILLLWRKEGKSPGRNRSEKRSATESLEKRVRSAPYSLLLDRAWQREANGTGSFLPSLHQDIRASSGTEPRAWWKDTQAYNSMSKEISLFFNVQIQWNSGSFLCCVGLSRRTQEGHQWATKASHGQSHTHIWSFLKVVCRPKVFPPEQSQTIFQAVWPLAKKERLKPHTTDNEGPLLSGIFDLCV